MTIKIQTFKNNFTKFKLFKTLNLENVDAQLTDA